MKASKLKHLIDSIPDDHEIMFIVGTSIHDDIVYIARGRDEDCEYEGCIPVTEDHWMLFLK